MLTLKPRPHLVALAALLSACAANPTAETRWGGRTIAVLPFSNESNDVEAPERVRSALEKELASRGYRLLPRAELDPAMKKLGVFDGAHLKTIPQAALAEELPAGAYCRGTLVDYVFKSVVALSQRRVELRLECSDKEGAKLFEGSGVGVLSKAGLDAAADLAMNVGGKVVKSVKDSGKKLLPGQTAKDAADATDKIADVELTEETREAIRKLLLEFPR